MVLTVSLSVSNSRPKNRKTEANTEGRRGNEFYSRELPAENGPIVVSVPNVGRNRRPAEGRLSRQALHPKDVARAQTPGPPQ